MTSEKLGNCEVMAYNFRRGKSVFLQFRMLALVMGVAVSTASVGADGLILFQPAAAQEAQLVFEHFMPTDSLENTQVIAPWVERIEAASRGRLKVKLAPAMGLGHKPFELLDKVARGEIDMAWTMAGYTPDRYPKLSVFELPWIASSRAAVTSMALQEYYETHALDEFKDVRILAIWCHPSGVIMSKSRVPVLPADLRGMKIRAPSTQLASLLTAFGAQPVHSPAPAVESGLSRGELDGTLFPYEVIPGFKLQGRIHSISEFAGDRGLYTAIMFLAINHESYNRLAPDLQRIIDENSGMTLAASFGRALDEIETTGREAYAGTGGTVTFIKGDQYEIWYRLSLPVIEGWARQQKEHGADGDKLLKSARELVAKYSARWAPGRE
jgi:TRAP-type transport system periplasmic protein